MNINKLATDLTTAIQNLTANRHYGEIGFFLKTNPQTSKYSYANWGSRRWEYRYVEDLLNKIGVKNRRVVDIGIGLPTDSDFYKSYIHSGCHLTGIDPDGRLKPVTNLSRKCRILRCSGEKIPLPAKSVDAVVVLSAFEHFPYKSFLATVREANRILKDDGDLIVTLDTTTADHKKSARWAILEKTINGLPSEENDLPLPNNGQPLSIGRFMKLVSPYFVARTKIIENSALPPDRLVYSKEWNSTVAYLHLYKRPAKRRNGKS